MPASNVVVVEGLRDLQKAFKVADVETSREIKKTLRTVAEPVRSGAESLAVQRIRRIGVPWSRMRVGVTQNSVYVAPRQRGRLSRQNPRLKRRNLAGLLLERAMEPALEVNEPRIIAGVDEMLATVGRKWEAV